MHRTSVNFPGILAAIIAMVMNTAGPAHAGGWPQAQGSGYYKIGMQFVHGDRYHDRYGYNVPVPALTDITVTAYGEYGITPKVTVFTSLPFFRSISSDGSLTEPDVSIAATGASDGELGLRIGLTQSGSSALSAVAAVGLPIGDMPDPENNIRFGDGEFNQYAGLAFGHSLWPLPVYLSAEAGFNLRHAGFTNEIRYNVEAGYTFAERLMVIFRIAGVQPLRDGNNDFQPGYGTGLYPNNQLYAAYGPEFVLRLDERFGISAGIQSAFAVQNALAAVAYTAGVYYTH